MTTTAQERVDHLSDGAPVFLPLVVFGHYEAHDAKASPEVARLLAYGEQAAGIHPYSGKELAVVETTDNDERTVVALDRLAHDRACAECAPVWEHYEAQTVGLEPGSMLSAAATVTVAGQDAQLIVDASDLADEDK